MGDRTKPSGTGTANKHTVSIPLAPRPEAQPMPAPRADQVRLTVAGRELKVPWDHLLDPREWFAQP